VADGFDGSAEVVGEGVGGGDDVGACLDLHGAVAAGGLDELADGPACLVLDPAATAVPRSFLGFESRFVAGVAM
jgi:hypothetical protein